MTSSLHTFDPASIGPDSELPSLDLAGRIGRLRATFDDLKIDALLVTSMVNIRYLTGFTGSSGTLLVLRDAAHLVTDGRYTEQAAEQLASCGASVELHITGTEQQAVLSARAAAVRRLGVEGDDISWNDARSYRSWFPASDLVPTKRAVLALRVLKDLGEVARIRRAASIADAALAETIALLVPGIAEVDVAAELDHRMRLLGSSDRAFETIVAAGDNGARPHARPSANKVEEGDLVVIDFGATHDGYRSDMTRTFLVGDASAERRRMHEVVTEAQAAGVAAVAVGAPASEVDRTCRDIIVEAGWGDAFSHGTGHGVGLDIHEEPRVNSRATATLAAGHIITVEPGVYLPGIGGVHVEDTLLVHDRGASALTLAPKPTF